MNSLENNIDTPQQVANVDAKSEKSEKTRKFLAFALQIIKALGLILLNILTGGLINFSPTIRAQYSRVFGGKEVKVVQDPNKENEGVENKDDVDKVEVKVKDVENKDDVDKVEIEQNNIDVDENDTTVETSENQSKDEEKKVSYQVVFASIDFRFICSTQLSEQEYLRENDFLISPQVIPSTFDVCSVVDHSEFDSYRNDMAAEINPSRFVQKLCDPVKDHPDFESIKNQILKKYEKVIKMVMSKKSIDEKQFKRKLDGCLKVLRKDSNIEDIKTKFKKIDPLGIHVTISLFTEDTEEAGKFLQKKSKMNAFSHLSQKTVKVPCALLKKHIMDGNPIEIFDDGKKFNINIINSDSIKFEEGYTSKQLNKMCLDKKQKDQLLKILTQKERQVKEYIKSLYSNENAIHDLISHYLCSNTIKNENMVVYQFSCDETASDQTLAKNITNLDEISKNFQDCTKASFTGCPDHPVLILDMLNLRLKNNKDSGVPLLLCAELKSGKKSKCSLKEFLYIVGKKPELNTTNVLLVAIYQLEEDGTFFCGRHFTFDKNCELKLTSFKNNVLQLQFGEFEGGFVNAKNQKMLSK